MNRFKGICRKCEIEVPAGAGRLINEGFRYNDRNAPAKWATECADAAECKARVAASPAAIEAAERAAAKHAARVVGEAADLAKWVARSPETVEVASAKSVVLPLGSTATRRKIKSGVRLVVGDYFTQDFASEAGAIVSICEFIEHETQRIESNRVDALPLPEPGTIYNRRYRSNRNSALNGTGQSMFLGTTRVHGVGEMAICAELTEEGSWLGYRDNIHTVKRYANGEGQTS